MAITRGVIPDCYTRGFRKVFLESFTEMEPYYKKLYNLQDGTGPYVKDSVYADVGLAAETGELVAPTYTTPVDMWDKTYTFKEIGQGLGISQTALDDDLYNQHKKLPGRCARAIRETVEIDAATPFTGGFATYTSPESAAIYLFATNHTTETGTDANRPATDLEFSRGAVESMLVMIDRTTTYRGRKALLHADIVVVPPETRFAARRVFGSSKEPDSANNAINPVTEEGLSVVVYPYLTAATKDWFIRCKEHQANFILRQAVKEEQDRDINLNYVFWVWRMRYQFGFTHYKGWFGVHPT